MELHATQLSPPARKTLAPPRRSLSPPEPVIVVEPEISKVFCSKESLLANERRGVLNLSYNIVSADINVKKRVILMDWLMEVRKMMKFVPNTYFATVNIVDACLGRMKTLTRVNLQLVGIAALGLASKYHEIYPPEILDIVFVCGNVYTSQEVLDMEEEIFKLLGCNINIPSDMEYMRAMSTISGATKESHTSGKWLLCATTVGGSKYLPSVLVSAIRYLMVQVYDDEEYVNHFEIPIHVVLMCARVIVSLVTRLQKSSRQAYIKTVNNNDQDEFNRVLVIIRNVKIPNMPLGDDTPYLKSTYFIEDIKLNLLDPSAVGKKAQMLGEGTFGEVKLVKYKGKEYAVKITKIVFTEEGNLPSSTLREMSIILSLNHPNVIKIQHITSDLKKIFLNLGESDLKGWIKQHGVFSKAMQVKLASQVFGALAYIHDMGCLHRDIKPQNIIVFSDTQGLRFELSDFGSSRGCEIAIKGAAFTHEVCTLWYRSPEILLGVRAYDDKLDVWSMLCTLYECATGNPLFPGQDEFSQLMSIFSHLGTPVEPSTVVGYVDDSLLWSGVSVLPGFLQSIPKYDPLRDLFEDNKMLSDCYKQLLTDGLMMNPAKRPLSSTVNTIVQMYL